MNYDICCIGHITLDKVMTPGNSVFMFGGTAYYLSHAVANLPINYQLVTAIADTEMEVIDSLKERGINVRRLPSRRTVFFENKYGQNQDERTQRVIQQADSFSTNDLESLEANIFHLGPLLADDIPEDVMKALALKGKVSLDVQGLLRKVDAQNVIAIDWERKRELLPFIHFIKASEEELKVLTGHADVYKGAQTLAEWGAKEVIVTLGSKGSLIYCEGLFYSIPSYTPEQVVDATGCGDTYMAGYLYKRATGSGFQQAGELLQQWQH